ncbi:MAG: FG-GAP repeat domain-containing protein, partial [Verrucomicrobiales bacterium]
MTNQPTTLLRRRALITIAVLGGLALVGCGDPGSDPGEGDRPNPASSQKPSGTIVQHPLQEQGGDGSAGGPRFVALSPQQSGISPNHTFNPGSPFPYLRDSGMEASGVSIGDIDGDGLPDLFLAGSPGNNRLYRQVGALKFEDITTSAGLDLDEAWSRGASMVDIDNDGDLDIYIANYSAANSLFINQGQSAEGKVHFVERAAQFGLDLLDASLMPSFCDYDHDGDLDLYVTVNMYHLPDKSNPPTAAQMIGQKDGKPIIKPPYDKFFRMTAYRKAPEGGFQVKWDRCGRPNHLFRNNGDGTFSNVTQAVGMEPDHGRSLSAAWWDYNEDGHPDLYVANDWGDRDCLYYNNGDGTFREAIKEAVPSTSMFTMGSDSGDLNNDGKIDFIAADMSGTTHYKRKVSMGSMQADKIAFMVAARPPQNMRNAVFLNTGTERLLEAAYLTGLANSDW